MENPCIPRLYAAASLKLLHPDLADVVPVAGIPRLYAAASLKRILDALDAVALRGYSAALSRL